MSTKIGSHAPEELLERYAMYNLCEAEAEALEDHLMFCRQCQDALDSVENFLLSARQASRLVRQEALAEDVRTSFWRRLARFLGLSPEIGWRSASWYVMPAAAVVMAGIAGVLMIAPSQTPEYQRVALSAVRGSEAGVVTSSELLELQLNTVGLQRDSAFRVEIVNAAGETLQQAVAQPVADAMSVRLQSRLAPGQYWVRVYSAASSVLVREYSLRSR